MPTSLILNVLALIFGPMLVLIAAWSVSTSRWWHDHRHQQPVAVGCDHCDRDREARPSRSDTP